MYFKSIIYYFKIIIQIRKMIDSLYLFFTSLLIDLHPNKWTRANTVH